MTLAQATRHATKLARRNNEEMFVIFENDEYYVADIFSLDTYYAGIEPTLIVYPNGEIER